MHGMVKSVFCQVPNELLQAFSLPVSHEVDLLVHSVCMHKAWLAGQMGGLMTHQGTKANGQKSKLFPEIGRVLCAIAPSNMGVSIVMGEPQ